MKIRVGVPTLQQVDEVLRLSLSKLRAEPVVDGPVLRLDLLLGPILADLSEIIKGSLACIKHLLDLRVSHQGLLDFSCGPPSRASHVSLEQVLGPASNILHALSLVVGIRQASFAAGDLAHGPDPEVIQLRVHGAHNALGLRELVQRVHHRLKLRGLY